MHELDSTTWIDRLSYLSRAVSTDMGTSIQLDVAPFFPPHRTHLDIYLLSAERRLR